MALFWLFCLLNIRHAVLSIDHTYGRLFIESNAKMALFWLFCLLNIRHAVLSIDHAYGMPTYKLSLARGCTVNSIDVEPWTANFKSRASSLRRACASINRACLLPFRSFPRLRCLRNDAENCQIKPNVLLCLSAVSIKIKVNVVIL